MYKPIIVRVLFVLESPPSSGLYFYENTGKVTEPLFSAMMNLLEYKPKSKEEGLKKFQALVKELLGI